MALTYTPLALKALDLTDPQQMQQFQKQLCDFLNAAFTSSNLSGILNGNKLLFLSQTMVTVFSTPTTNQTVNTNQASLIWIAYTWATAANFTVTLNNVADGALLMFYFTNSSGAPRTITLSANTPAPAAMTVATGNSVLSSGVSVASATSVVFFGMASVANTRLLGTGQNW